MNETAQLYYLKSLPRYEFETPYHNFIDNTSNIITELVQSQPVLDIRGRENEFKLVPHGFEYRRRTLPVVNWNDKGDIQNIYVEDLKSFVSELVPETVQRCEMFDFRVRLD